ncbi:hypothetical protein [Pedobacter sp. Leaf216]|uniref:hypothetical protein n=1 Tax=Pedobacter sp. Leaf216 TaxID=1735684 RepID=UPI0012F75463|nr:hypothetical protein [Pedobacter sp. Leaf216]
MEKSSQNISHKNYVVKTYGINAMKSMNEKLNNMPILRIAGIEIEAVAKEMNPVL